MLGIFGIVINRKWVWVYKRVSNSGKVGFIVDFSPRSFTYSNIEKITNGFKEELGRGKGSFGTRGVHQIAQNVKTAPKLIIK